MKTEAETGMMQTRKTRNAGSHKKLKEEREDSLLEPFEGEQPGQHLDFRHLTSRTLRELISVLSHSVCGDLLWQP